MNIIHSNPYNVASILSSATTKELEKQTGENKAYARVGREIKFDFDFQILMNIDRTEDSVNKAFSNIEQNQNKVDYALFWFLNASPFGNTAIEYLKNGDEEKGLEIRKNVTTNRDFRSENFSAFNNLGTSKLLNRNKVNIKLKYILDLESYELFREIRDKDIIDFLTKSINSFYKKNNTKIEESLFFYSLIGMLNKLSFELAVNH